jgi:S1-C subfamily serine protease
MTGKLVAAVVLVAAFAAGLVVSGRMSLTEPGWSAPAPPAVPAPGQTPPGASLAAGAGLPNLSDVAERALKVSVNISSTTMRVINDPWMRLLGQDLVEPSQSLGSGVVVSSDGYVLTNTHVIGTERADIRVTLADGKEREGRLVGLDDVTDLAVVKIDAEGLDTLPWGDSSKLRVAEWVLAIGNPFQLNQTVTLGIVSALGRANVGISDYEDFIQTDAAINPGNSGGALVNTRGELVGINTAIFSRSGGYQGIGFAVPSNLARRVVNDLTQYGEVRRGSIGYVEIAPLSTLAAQQLGVPDARGVLIQAMRRDASAYEAGLRPGDVIVAFNATTISDGGQLLRLIQDARIGSTAVVAVIREADRIELKIPISGPS